MRASPAAVAACLLGGCSWLFDADRIALAPPADAAMGSDAAVTLDLAVEQPPDLAIAVEDLAIEPPVDLAPADCNPARFAGFPDGAAESAVTCPRCGCLLDDFTAFSTVRWQPLTVGAVPWGAVPGDGGLT